MNQSQRQSLPPSYFDNLYQANPDPWEFETSEYEASKYAATVAALPKQRYRSAFEIGGSIGVLTAKLAERCDSLLSVDVSELAQNQAIQRCQALPQVRFQLMGVPEAYPDEMFDLTLVSEVGYARDYPLSGDQVHDSFFELTPSKLRHLGGRREEQYRLDLFERVEGD